MWVNFFLQFFFNTVYRKLLWKSGDFYKTFFLGKLLLLIHLYFNHVISRPGRSQGLLYKEPCDSFID